MRQVSKQQLKKRRSVVLLIIALFLGLLGIAPDTNEEDSFQRADTTNNQVLSEEVDAGTLTPANAALNELSVKGRAPKTGYSRDEFGDGWLIVEGCSLRNIMLQRGLTELSLADDGCVVLSGVLNDPYTNKQVAFLRGSTTSADVQIDHVVALSDAWQKGAQQLSFEARQQFANDPLNLLAVDGDANQAKGDSDAASWLPPNKYYRCRYVARQVAVKQKYQLWVTEAEKAAMQRILNGCGDQALPVNT